VSEDDHFTPEPSVAIDLSRRKSARPPAGPDLLRERAGLDAVRHSITGARRAAAPYVTPYLTMVRISLARLVRDRLARAGVLILALLGFAGVFADLLASDLPIACRWRGSLYLLPNVTHPLALDGVSCARMQRGRGAGDWMIPPLVAYGPAERGAPAEELRAPLAHGHPLGTDVHGRDVFARIVHGARTALGIGLAASSMLVAIGVALGALAGFAGGIVDALVSRAVEALTAVPTLVLVLVVGALLPYPSTTTLLCTIALTRWTELARLVRGEVLAALGTDYVSAARALGASPPRVFWRHVLPNAIGPAIVGAAFAVAWVVLIEATVDFLRVGSSDAAASWGEVMAEARDHANAWWLVAFPGLALLTTLIGLNLIGEAARGALDPRLRGDELPG
jgi:peptide/nickel transport system permease protein